MSINARYFKLLDAIGVEPSVKVVGVNPETGNPDEESNPRAGELQPLTSVGVRVLVDVGISGDTILRDVKSIEITADGAYTMLDDPKTGRRSRVGLPKTDDKVFDAAGRILALTTPAIIDGIMKCEQYAEIEAPPSAQTRKPKSASAGEEQ